MAMLIEYCDGILSKKKIMMIFCVTVCRNLVRKVFTIFHIICCHGILEYMILALSKQKENHLL